MIWSLWCCPHRSKLLKIEILDQLDQVRWSLEICERWLSFTSNLSWLVVSVRGGDVHMLCACLVNWTSFQTCDRVHSSKLSQNWYIFTDHCFWDLSDNLCCKVGQWWEDGQSKRLRSDYSLASLVSRPQVSQNCFSLGLNKYFCSIQHHERHKSRPVTVSSLNQRSCNPNVALN